jgi:hypothetical protein
MGMKQVKARWAAKLLRSKHFVVLTDKESVICLQGADPDNIEDFVILAAQTAELQDFSDKLKLLIKDHDRAIRRMKGDRPAKPITKRKNTKVQG